LYIWGNGTLSLEGRGGGAGELLRGKYTKRISSSSTDREGVEEVSRGSGRSTRRGGSRRRSSAHVLCADLAAHHELVDVVELVPVLLVGVDVAEERLELGPARDGEVERLGGEEGLLVEEVLVVGV